MASKPVLLIERVRHYFFCDFSCDKLEVRLGDSLSLLFTLVVAVLS